MNNQTERMWEQAFEDVVDQRDIHLPPTWFETLSQQSTVSEWGQKVHQSGKKRQVANHLISLLSQAQEKVVLASFLFADQEIEDALLTAAKRGVRVYVLVASEARLGSEEGEGEFDKKVLAQHKEMLSRLGGYVLFRSAPHFHAKVVLIDPETRPAGMLLTANLTYEALGRNDELAITLSTDEVSEVTAYVRWAMWESAEHELVDPKDRFRAVRPLGQIAHPSPRAGIVVTTSSANTIREEMLNIINNAHSKIVVSSFGWDVGHEVVQRLCARAEEGIEVVALARIRPASMPALVALGKAGVKIFGFRWLHAKAIWADSGHAVVMSANVQTHGLDQGFELGVRLDQTHAQELFTRLMEWRDAAPWQLAIHPALGGVVGKIRVWNQRRLEEFAVKSSIEIELDSVTAVSAESLQASRPTLPDGGVLPHHMAHQLRYIWRVEAPYLAKNAKEVFKTSKPQQSYVPPVYREPGGRVVVVVASPTDLQPAALIKDEVKAEVIVVAKGER